MHCGELGVAASLEALQGRCQRQQDAVTGRKACQSGRPARSAPFAGKGAACAGG